MNIRKMKKGLTLIELIISLALLGIIIVPIGGYALGSIKNSLESEKKQKASFIGQRFLEEIKAYDEIVLKTSEEGKKYFQLLDGEIIFKEQDSSEVKDEHGVIKKLPEIYRGNFEKDNFKLETEIKEDEIFKYNNINNLENITDETFTLNLRASVGIASLEIKENLTKVSDFRNDLVITLEENLKIKIDDSLTEQELVSDSSSNNLKNTIIINIEKSFSLNKKIEIRNKTGKTINIYVVKDKASTGQVNVFATEGSVFINDEIDLYEENIDGKKFNYSIKVRDKKNKLIFEGNSSSNLNLK